MSSLIPMITIRETDQCNSYKISSTLLILPDDIRDKIFRALPDIIQIALAINDTLICQILQPYSKCIGISMRKGPNTLFNFVFVLGRKFNFCVDRLYSEVYILTVLYGKTKTEYTLLNDLKYLSNIPYESPFQTNVNNTPWHLRRCMVCRACVISNVRLGLNFIADIRKNVDLVCDIICQLIKFHKLSFIDIYSIQNLNKSCAYDNTSRCVIKANRLELYYLQQDDRYYLEHIVQIFESALKNQVGMNTKQIGLESPSKEVYHILTEMLQSNIPRASTLCKYICSKLKYPLYWNVPTKSESLNMRFVHTIEDKSYTYTDPFMIYMVRDIINPDYLIYHLKRLCPETVKIVTQIVEHMLIYHKAQILTSSVVNCAIKCRKLNSCYHTLYSLIINNYNRIYKSVINNK